MFYAGVDVGSTQTKAVILDGGGHIVGRALVATGAHVERAARRAFDAACDQASLETAAVAFTVGTGYGRFQVSFGDAQVTEISCHARGACQLFPGTRTVLDIGGQDTKAIRIDAGGGVLDFCMNDKCAAGTGRFLEAVAVALDIDLAELGKVALSSTRPVKMTSTCAVFAESEILGWLARGRHLGDILLGVHQAVALRALSLLRRIGPDSPYAFTGGVSRNPAVLAQLEAALGQLLQTGADAHFSGAIGAALFARERALPQPGRTGT